MLQSTWNQRRTEPEASERHPESAQASARCTDRRSCMMEKGAEKCCDPNGRDCPVTSSELAAQRRDGRGHWGTQPAQGPSTQLPTSVASRGQRDPWATRQACLRPWASSSAGRMVRGCQRPPPHPHATRGVEPVWAGWVPQGPCPHRVRLSQKLSSRQEHRRTTPQALTGFLDCVCVTSNPSESQGHWCCFCLHAED